MIFSKTVRSIKAKFYKYPFIAKAKARFKLSNLDFTEHSPILILQVGKVGSTSIHHTLDSMDLRRPLFHAHYLTEKGIKYGRSWHKKHTGAVPAIYLDYCKFLGRKVRKNLNRADYTIITGVRDPIAYEISDFFQLAKLVDHKCYDERGDLSPDLIIEYLLKRFRTFDDSEDDFFSTDWIDQEIKGNLGIDLYEYPFDPSKGYEVVRAGKITLLVYQFEKLQTSYKQAMAELLGIKPALIPDLRTSNIGQAKWYSEIYRSVMDNIVIPVEVCEKIYSTKHVQHFYDQETINQWIKRWSQQ